MNQHTTFFTTAILMLARLGSSVHADGPGVTYQGEIKQFDKTLNGIADVTFTLFDAESDGAPLGATQFFDDLEIVDGKFTVVLNDANQFGANAFNGEARWLEVTVDGVTLAPRQPLTSAPLAHFATNAPFRRNGSTIYYNDGYLGIGTNSPDVKLDIDEGNLRASNSQAFDFNYAISARLTNQGPGAFSAGVHGEIAHGSATDGVGVRGLHHGYGVGVTGESINGIGVHGLAHSMTAYAGYFEYGKNYFERLVGIGTLNPQAQLHVMGGLDTTPQDGGYVVLGPTAGANISVDNNEIMARNNGLPATLAINAEGGDITLIQAGVGFVGIGTASPAFRLHVNGSAGKPGGGSWSNSSDARLKKNIAPLHEALDQLLSIQGVTFEYIDPAAVNELPGTQVGVIAQDVELTFPQWVDEGPDGFKRVTFRGFEALTIESLRDLRAEKDAQIASLHAENRDLRERIERLEALLAAQTD